MSNTLLEYVIIVGGLIYLLIVLYKIVKPEFMKVKAKPVRSLTIEEQKLLQSYVAVISKIEHPFILILVILFFFIISLIFFLISDYIQALVWFLLGILVLKFNRPKLDKKYYASDLTVPVYQIEGKVFTGLSVGIKGYQMLLMRSLNTSSRIWNFKVGQYSFNQEKVIDAYQTTASTLKDGDIISVEFSPRTKFAWKITRLS